MIGRPSDYSDALASEICRRIMEGQSMREVCRDEAMPNRSTVYAWIADKPDFSNQYARACDVRAEAVFDEMFEIADDGTNDWMERQGDQGEAYALNGDHVQRSRLRIETRKWALARMAPRKYGDKLTLGNDPDNPMPVTQIILAAADDAGEA